MRNKLWIVLAVVVVLSLAAMAAACTPATPKFRLSKRQSWSRRRSLRRRQWKSLKNR